MSIYLYVQQTYCLFDFKCMRLSVCLNVFCVCLLLCVSSFSFIVSVSLSLALCVVSQSVSFYLGISLTVCLLVSLSLGGVWFSALCDLVRVPEWEKGDFWSQFTMVSITFILAMWNVDCFDRILLHSAVDFDTIYSGKVQCFFTFAFPKAHVCFFYPFCDHSAVALFLCSAKGSCMIFLSLLRP